MSKKKKKTFDANFHFTLYQLFPAMFKPRETLFLFLSVLHSVTTQIHIIHDSICKHFYKIFMDCSGVLTMITAIAMIPPY